MSGTLTIASTLPAPPDIAANAQAILALMGAVSGVTTDYNVGSQIRTLSESLGAVVEQQGIANNQQAITGLTYGAISAFDITPYLAGYGGGNLLFTTAIYTSATFPPATQNVTIPAGTILQTSGGIQFQTIAAATLSVGSSSVNVAAQCLTGGITGNVGQNTINQIVTNIGYQLFVTNPAAFKGGSPAEQASATLARFTSKVASLGNCTPYAIANAAVGVANGTEVVQVASCYEPWLAGGAASGTVGFTVYIDNGYGDSSAQLVANVTTAITGNNSASLPGNRPAGVPFTVAAATPVYVEIDVVGTVYPYVSAASIESDISNALSSYFSAQGIGVAIYSGLINAEVSSAGQGYFTSLTVTLKVVGGSGVTVITPTYSQRAILQTLNTSGITVSSV